MAYVIAEPGIGTKDTACVDACPVDCIHPKKNTAYDDGLPSFDEVEKLYIGEISAESGTSGSGANQRLRNRASASGSVLETSSASDTGLACSSSGHGE